MKEFIKALFWFLVLALAALFFHAIYGEKKCGVCRSETTEVNNKQPTTSHEKVSQKLSNFMITAVDGSTVFKFPDNFVINSRDGKVEIPQTMVGFKDSIYNYLNNNQGKELLISANYLKSEGAPVGLNRANFLKSLLVNEAKINPNRIVPKAVLSDYSYDDNEKYGEGIALLFRNISKENKQALTQSITTKTLYTDFASTTFKADKTLRSYALELKNHLQNNPTKKVSLTGYTDNVGRADLNYKLGLKRANQVLKYLVSEGVTKSKITAKSKGETNPVATNDTEEGRAKNRRIFIEVK